LAKISKVAVFSPFYPPHVGGVERYAASLAVSLHRDLGLDVCAVAFARSARASVRAERGVEVYRLPAAGMLGGRFPLPRINRSFIAALARLAAKEVDAYIVNTRFFLSSVLGALLAKLGRKPLAVIEHGSSHLEAGNALLSLAGRAWEHVVSKITGGTADVVLGVSAASCRWLGHFHLEADGVAHHGLDTGAATKGAQLTDGLYVLTENAITISYVGRLIREKGVGELAQAFTLLAGDHPRARLVVAGDGPMLPELRARHGSDKGICFAGPLEHDRVQALLEVSDVFVYPSDYPEGLPIALLEAGQHGCAVVVTDRGGVREVVPDGRFGVILPRADARSIRRALGLLLSDEALRARMAANLREHVTAAFDRRRNSEMLIERLERVVRARHE